MVGYSRKNYLYLQVNCKTFCNNFPSKNQIFVNYLRAYAYYYFIHTKNEENVTVESENQEDGENGDN